MKDELSQRKNEGKMLQMRRHHLELPPVEEGKGNQMIIEDQRKTLVAKKTKCSKEEFDKYEKLQDIESLYEIEEESNPKKIVKGMKLKKVIL